jgi:hypothetical protein
VRSDGSGMRRMVLPPEPRPMANPTPPNTTDSAWVSVEDRLPDTNEDVAVAFLNGGVFSGYYDLRGAWLWGNGRPFSLTPTHWMPLPLHPALEQAASETPRADRCNQTSEPQWKPSPWKCSCGEWHSAATAYCDHFWVTLTHPRKWAPWLHTQVEQTPEDPTNVLINRADLYT